jgi:acetyl/propionyl-CoA carboxylase alpha subunit
MILTDGESAHEIRVTELSADGGAKVSVDGSILEVRLVPLGDGTFRVQSGAREETLRLVVDKEWIHFFWQGRAYRLRQEEGRPTRGSPPGRLEAPMPGRIIEVRVKEGDLVEAGAPLIVIEAMKMETVLRAPRAGRVKVLRAQKGARTIPGTVLAEIE